MTYRADEWATTDCANPTCPDCGTRCDDCDERVCSEYGPEPALTCPDHFLCVDCDASNRCAECADWKAVMAS